MRTHLLALWHRTFVAPLRRQQMATLYVAQVVGLFAQGFLALYCALDMIRLGPEGVLAYLLSWVVAAGLVLFPLLYAALCHWPRRLVGFGLLAMQLAGVGLAALVDLANQPALLGLAMALFATPYWQAHHLALAGHSSDSNRGFEVSLAKVVLVVSAVTGAGAGGLVLEYAGSTSLVLGAFGLMVAALLLLIAILPAIRLTDTEHAERQEGVVGIGSLHAALTQWPRQNWASVVEGMFDSTISFAQPVLLAKLGMTAALVGLLQGLKAVASIIIAPFAGRWIQQQQGQEFRVAAVTGVMGWAPLTLGMNGLPVLVGCSLLWAGAALLFRTGLHSRWYSRRSATQLLMREWMLTIGRVIVLPPLVWACFYWPVGYALMALAICFLIWPLGGWLARSHHEGAL